MSSQESMGRRLVFIPLIAAVVLTGFWFTQSSHELVVYCAHDKVYSEAILKDFEKRTGIRVDVRYDTEATKSLGLVNLIVAERKQPRCDVFWNNELLGTVELQEQGLLEPYKGDGWKRLPQNYRDDDGHWVGFGARLRVQIVNTNEVAADPQTVAKLFDLEPGSAAVAKPLFGTTLTHYTVLWNEWGPERLKTWHHDLRLRGIREVDGNGAVKDLVAQGVCSAGLTDTDDFFVAKDDGKTVAMLPVMVTRVNELNTGERLNGKAPAAGSSDRQEASQHREGPAASASPLKNSDLDSKRTPQAKAPLTLTLSPQSRGEGTEPRTICIPNTAAIIKGTKRIESARKLIDFLASAETELALARSKSRQVPLGPVDESQLSEEVRQLTKWSADGVDLRPLLPARRECLEWLKSEYLK